VNNGSSHPHHTRSRQDWRVAQSSQSFSWLYSEPRSLFPVDLGRNWYFLVQPQKKTSAKPWCDGVTSRHQQRSPPYRCSLFHIHHMLTYHIPPSRKRKRSRRVLLPALLASSVCVGAINELSESKKEHSPTPLLLMPSEKERSPTPSLPWFSESKKERSPILLPFLLVESAGVPHVEAIVALPKLMNERTPIPLPHTKSAKKNDCLGGFFASHFLGSFYSSHCFGCFYSSVFCLSLSIG